MIFRKRNKIKFPFKIAFSKKWEATCCANLRKISQLSGYKEGEPLAEVEINSNLETCFLWLKGGKNLAML